MINFIACFFLLFLQTLNPYKILEFKHQQIYADIFHHIYIQQFQTLQKIDSTGKTLFTYSNSALGNIAYVDVTNPMQILVFHKEYNSIVFLSNNLTSLTNPINLDDLNLNNVKAVCNSKYGGFWVYDANLSQLLLFNSKLLNVYKGTKVFINHISNIIEHNNFVYIVEKNKGIWKFNYKGEMIEFIPIEDIQNICVYKEKLVYIKHNEVEMPNFKTISFQKSLKNVVFLKETVVIADDDKLEFYKLSIN